MLGNIFITDETQIAESFNKLFKEIGPKLAKEIEIHKI